VLLETSPSDRPQWRTSMNMGNEGVARCSCSRSWIAPSPTPGLVQSQTSPHTSYSGRGSSD
jgi:hypothetical protein